MKIRLINPNTTESMTEKMGASARAFTLPSTELIACHPESGPASIESHFDEAISAVGVLDEIRKGEAQQTDAYIIACFGDPGLLAARELTAAPVLGIAEAAFHVASLLSTRFSIVTTLGRTAIIAEHLLQTYGFAQHCRRIRAAEIPVLDLECNEDVALDRIVEECLRAKSEDGIGAIVLGCGGMSELTPRIAHATGIPVIDGVSAAIKLAESLVNLKLSTSKHGDLASPRPKAFTGRFKYLSHLP